MKHAGLLLAALLLWPAPALAGAWVEEEGRSYADLQIVAFPGATDAGGELEPFLQGGVYAYLETGLLGGWLAGLVRAPLYVVNLRPQARQSAGGMGDVAVGMKVALDRVRPVAFEGWAVLPTALGRGAPGQPHYGSVLEAWRLLGLGGQPKPHAERG